MRFDESVPAADRRKIKQALQDIKAYGNGQQRSTAQFIEDSEISIHLGFAKNVGGSGSILVDRIIAANWAILRGGLTAFEAAKFLRLNIARETIDTGGQRGIEGTFVHEGKHARDFALMLASFSGGGGRKYFNPTAFQREYSAHLTSAFYLMRRGGEYTAEGVSLGILFENGGKICVNPQGIRARLENNYGLTSNTPGYRLSELSHPNFAPRGTRLWGLL
ncbi:MAG: hypothetical protein WA584_06500 [Pyrinomonadaceae bacterium]